MNKLPFAGLLLAALTMSTAARAQTPGSWGSWFIGSVQLPGSAEHKWGGFAEVQARANGLFRQYFYNELKAGVSYDITPNFTVLLAGGRYATSDYRDLEAGPLNTEKRLWQQVVLTQYASRLKLEHRYRIEQRWLTFRDDSSAFRQRLRYRLNAFVPLNEKSIQAGTVFLSAYDEIFLNPRGPAFERNRVYAGVGYQFSPHLIGQVGWVNQANFNQPAYLKGRFLPQSTSAKHNVVLAVTYKLAQRTGEKLPSQQD